MPSVPAFCDTCGAAFNSGVFVENSSNITFHGNRAGPCPRCGGLGHVPDGIFNFIGSTIEILAAPQRTVSELMGLAIILQEARARAETKEQVTTRIEKELPAFSLLAKILPENKNELYSFLGVIIAAVALYTQSSEKPPSQTIINVNQVVQQVIVEQPKLKNATPDSKPSSKLGRNDPCPCGSGKKYQKCCGSVQ